MPPTDRSPLSVNSKVPFDSPAPTPSLTWLHSPTLPMTTWSPQAPCCPLTVHSLRSAGRCWATGSGGYHEPGWRVRAGGWRQHARKLLRPGLGIFKRRKVDLRPSRQSRLQVSDSEALIPWIGSPDVGSPAEHEGTTTGLSLQFPLLVCSN